MQASGLRSQNCRASEAAAEATDMASAALTCAPLLAGCEPALGRSTRTTPSQNAKRSRNLMTSRPVPGSGSLIASFGHTLPARLEGDVRNEASFLGRLDANARRVFVKLE